jgi:hypothetical protein
LLAWLLRAFELNSWLIVCTRLLSQPDSKKEQVLLNPNGIKISTASTITRNPELKYDKKCYIGRPAKASVHRITTERSIHCYIETEDVHSKALPFDLMDEIAQFLGVKDDVHRRLVYVALSEKSSREISLIFKAEGYDVDIPKGMSTCHD